jgi:hypothetical protein
MCDCQIPEDAFKVGDQIEFDYYDGIRTKKEKGEIVSVGKHGYWIAAFTGGCYGTASIRCPFPAARKVGHE